MFFHQTVVHPIVLSSNRFWTKNSNFHNFLTFKRIYDSNYITLRSRINHSVFLLILKIWNCSVLVHRHSDIFPCFITLVQSLLLQQKQLSISSTQQLMNRGCETISYPTVKYDMTATPCVNVFKTSPYLAAIASNSKMQQRTFKQ